MFTSRSPAFGRIVRISLAAFVVAAVLADEPASAQAKRRRRVLPRRATKRPVGKRPVRRRPAKKFGSKKLKTKKPAGPAAGPGKVKTNTGNGTSPLAKVYAGNDGGAYYVTEYKKAGKSMVTWFAEHPGRGYAHIFRGVRLGNAINGSYLSIPKAKSTTSGQLKVKVNSNGTMVRISATGQFPTTSWSVRSIKSIVNLLPGKKNPGFTSNKFGDLNGVFDDSKGYRYYVRQSGKYVYAVAEAPFKKGQQPAAVVVIMAERNNTTLSGTAIAVPKGKKEGRAPIKFVVRNDRSMMKSTSLPFGGGALMPVLPDIRIPIKDVMDILNSQMNKVEIVLDGYHNGPAKKSYVKFGSAKPTYFDVPYVTVKITKLGRKRQTFINDIKSDIINVKSLSGNLSRLSVVFETGGKELKRRMVGAAGDDDKRLADWDINSPRVDVEFSLVNYGKSISYEVKKVKLHAVVDVRALTEKLDEWVSKKLRPIVEKELMKELNKSTHRSKVSDLVDAKVKSLKDYLSKYKAFGYSAASLAPKKVFISGSDVVIRFRD